MKEKRGGGKSIFCSYLVYCLLRTKSLNLREHIKERFGIGVNRHAMNETYCDEVSENLTTLVTVGNAKRGLVYYLIRATKLSLKGT